MNKYCVNGFKFQTEEVSRNKKTNNSGVYIQGDVDGTGQTIEYHVDVELETTLQHPQHILEEVSDDEILNVEEEISENEENESFDDEEWDDNENETTEEEEWENDGIEISGRNSLSSGGDSDRHREHLGVSQTKQAKNKKSRRP
ncbi:hypothetical protein H5410_027792 [Solanum commersonii]|uniref:Uncharacterized protein n=1 Tax=Solanum commersonii TaxID=4109 RepID=A0A9J5Z4D2_SOLCO|nr:hypothetical protein H5410_027792 [Solanum commersonii]